jgi:hypothetical protein
MFGGLREGNYVHLNLNYDYDVPQQILKHFYFCFLKIFFFKDLQLKQDRHIVKDSVKNRNLRLYIQAARWSRGMIVKPIMF